MNFSKTIFSNQNKLGMTEPVTRGQNLIRSHVPYVGTGKIVYEMITQDMTTAD